MKIVFFDGYCSLCNSIVDALMRIDKSGRLKFASLQGETAAKRLGAGSTVPIDVDTVVYLRDGEKFEKSEAALRILSDLGGAWTLARLFLVVPAFIRDFVYRIIAKNRFRLIKKRDTCRLPTPQEQDRLLR